MTAAPDPAPRPTRPARPARRATGDEQTDTHDTDDMEATRNRSDSMAGADVANGEAGVLDDDLGGDLGS